MATSAAADIRDPQPAHVGEHRIRDTFLERDERVGVGVVHPGPLVIPLACRQMDGRWIDRHAASVHRDASPAQEKRLLACAGSL